MNKKLLIVALVPLVASCSNIRTYQLEDYQTNLSYKDDFSILVLNDLHLAYTSNLKVEFDYYLKVIFSRAALQYPNLDIVELLKNEQMKTQIYEFAPDLIMLNGDTFMNASKNVVIETFRFFDDVAIPYGFLNGNHDLQGFYSNQFVYEQLAKSKYAVNKNLQDDITGQTNFVVNINKGNEIKWQIYGIDCNTYEDFEYDCIQDDQVEWYKQQVISTKDKRITNDYAPSLLLTHIPVSEFKDAWKLETSGQCTINPSKDYQGKSTWWINEGVNCSPKEDELFETIQELGGPTKGIISAHDHINISDFYYRGDGDHEVRLIYSMKTGQGIYHDKRMMGGVFYTLKEDETFDKLVLNVPYGFDYENNTNGVYEMNDEFINKGGKI